jgi:hypothetical protein
MSDKNINESLRDKLDLLQCKYAFIYHNKDINDNGELKKAHYHIIIYEHKRTYCSTILNKLVELLGVNPLAITIDKCVDIQGAIQYLIHKNDKEKYQYNELDIVSNIDNDELINILTSENNSLSIDRLIQICFEERNRINIMRRIGLGYYHLYRNVITDILNEMETY